MPASTDILNDLEDARQELKALQKQEKRGRKYITAGIATLSGMAAALIMTGEGLFAWLLFLASALFCVAIYDLYQAPPTLIRRAGFRVSKLEREYSTAVLRESHV